MIRISKMTDYGIVLLTQMVQSESAGAYSSKELASSSGLPHPTTHKILKILARANLLTSRRGAKGGYLLARPPSSISMAAVVDALEGPLAITKCLEGPIRNRSSRCTIESHCPVRGNWSHINKAIHGALSAITLADMSKPLDFRGRYSAVDATRRDGDTVLS